MKTLIGCCMIHLAIGSIYSLSTLYSAISQQTGWDNSVLVHGFALIILALGITASVHQKFMCTLQKKTVLEFGALMWFLVQSFNFANFGFISNSIFLWYCWGILLGISIGLLYVIPINIVVTAGYSRPGLASGAVVCCFGLGSIIAAPLYSYIPLEYICLVFAGEFIIMRVGILLVKDKSFIQPLTDFNPDKKWYLLAVMFFLNIGIGISLLANLKQLTVDNGFTVSEAVALVALAGAANTLGRIIYSSVSDYIGKFQMLGAMLVIQLLAVVSAEYLHTWRISVAIIISVYGGVFALMPSLMTQLYRTPSAYSRILAMWGIAGLLCPIIFSLIGYSSLILMSILLVLCYIYLIKS